MNNIYLIGMMGCGKSTLGKLAAKKANRKFVDVDEAIVNQAGTPITKIFEDSGELVFRDLESKALRQISLLNDAIISCGGGIVLRPENINLMHNTGKIIYIFRNIDDIIAMVDTKTRPLLQDDGSNIKSMYKSRKNIYETTCDIKLDNNDTLQVVVEKLVSIIGN